MSKAHLLIGASSSGGGKTTFTAGLLRLLHERGLRVQPFKCGPDYIDTQYHKMACGRDSVNLDLWMSSRTHVRHLYDKYSTDADVCITEGVMGLFDGFDGMHGSSAEISAVNGLPVILLVNAKSTSYTVAPLIYGFRHFHPEINIAGVVFNQVASDKHFAQLKKACNDTDTECFGYMPKIKELEVPSRHLGLTLDASYRFDAFASQAAEAIAAHVDIDRMLEKCTTTTRVCGDYIPAHHRQDMHIAVAKDEAFNFTYTENIERLKEMGQVTYFSPICDKEIPAADMIYLPGGYPEFFLPQLSSNKDMLKAISDYAESGGRILAECGGMMYLCRSITGIDGATYKMADVLPIEATMSNMRLHLGYRTLKVGGNIYKGHEFHYSSVNDEQMESIAAITDAKGNGTGTKLYRHKNVIAGYTHLYWGETDIMKLWEI